MTSQYCSHNVELCYLLKFCKLLELLLACILGYSNILNPSHFALIHVKTSKDINLHYWIIITNVICTIYCTIYCKYRFDFYSKINSSH